MTKPNSSEIVVLVDRSGSMQTIREDMEGSFATLIEEQRKARVDCKVSLWQFDDNLELVYEGMPLYGVPPMLLIPRGNTALWDALGKVITKTGERLAKTPEWERPEKVIFVLITDGKENASRFFGQNLVRDMIKHQEKIYSWGFVYLGSSPSTAEDAQAIGIRSYSQYTASPRGVEAMGQVVGNAVAAYCLNSTATMDSFVLPTEIPEAPPAEQDLTLGDSEFFASQKT